MCAVDINRNENVPAFCDGNQCVSLKRSRVLEGVF